MIRGREHGHPGLRAHHRDVLERVVRQPVHPVLETAADAHDPHRQPVQHRAVADELVRPERRERRDRVGEGDEAGLGEARRDADHVLLGDADVEEAVREPLGERLDDREAEVACQQDDALVLLGELDERPDEGRSSRRHLLHRTLELPLGHRQVVPLDAALHEGDALAEDRVRDEHMGRPRLDVELANGVASATGS